MIEGGLLVHGGRGSDGAVLQDIALFDCRSQTWVLHHDSGIPCCAHAAANTAAAAAAAKAARSAAAAAAAAEGGPADAGGGQPGGGRAASVAANVLLYGGFSGEQVRILRVGWKCGVVRQRLGPLSAHVFGHALHAPAGVG